MRSAILYAKMADFLGTSNMADLRRWFCLSNDSINGAEDQVQSIFFKGVGIQYPSQYKLPNNIDHMCLVKMKFDYVYVQPYPYISMNQMVFCFDMFRQW